MVPSSAVALIFRSCGKISDFAANEWYLIICSGIVIFSAWVALMNNLGLTLTKTLVLLIFPVVFIGIANNSKMERDQKIIIGKIRSFSSIILLIVANFLDVTFYFYAPYPETGRLLIFILLLNVLSLILYIFIYILLKIKTE